jgi:glycosyltransferase A (GT-A) superfamily protein (DUF2064 family)
VNGRVLVVAKAPVEGVAKTRLAAVVGDRAAARLAAAALLDVLAAAEAAVGRTACHLSLAGDLGDAVRGREIADAVRGWTVHRQAGESFADRLVHAHRCAGPGPLVQVGMDTPQASPEQLVALLAGLDGADAVLAPAVDGGWWALALREPRHAAALADVAMSTPRTGDDTRSALEAQGLCVAGGPPLVDVDTAEDARVVAAAAPGTRFAAAWREREGEER